MAAVNLLFWQLPFNPTLQLSLEKHFKMPCISLALHNGLFQFNLKTCLMGLCATMVALSKDWGSLGEVDPKVGGEGTAPSWAASSQSCGWCRGLGDSPSLTAPQDLMSAPAS